MQEFAPSKKSEGFTLAASMRVICRCTAASAAAFTEQVDEADAPMG